MKSQQIAVYASLNDFMVAVGYQNAGDRREDDPVWSTLNQNNYSAMMQYKFGVEPRFASDVPSKLEAVHSAITAHEAWAYREDLEHDDGEEAPVIVFSAPATVEPAGSIEPEGDVDTGEGNGEPASTEQQPEGSQEPATPPADEQPQQPEVPAEAPKEDAIEEPEEPAAEEGGDSEQE